MILSDRSIREELAAGRIGISPFQDHQIQPSSVDLRLGSRFRRFQRTNKPFIDVKHPVHDLMEVLDVADGEPVIVRPREFMLGTTVETITIPDDMVGQLEGRSSLGRLGIIIHSTAGYIDPGFSGQVTLEISNLLEEAVALYPGMRIAQIFFSRMTTPADRPYGSGDLASKYQGQEDTTASRLYLDFLEEPAK
ncbi:MAG TPA: dCTP deaminase [Chloroflexota bacterium]|nr:dCTP deaminase [Chloroflexota bacterium]